MKISTWNVCLGLTTKKEDITRVLNDNKIDICCFQEAEIPINFPINELSINGYLIEVEINAFKIRTCTCIKKWHQLKKKKRPYYYF
jgi:exonuclease III